MWVLALNDMRSSKFEYIQPVFRAETKEALKAFVESHKVEHYTTNNTRVLNHTTDQMAGMTEVNDNYKFSKGFKFGGPLEWFNAPDEHNESGHYLDVGTEEDWMLTAKEEFKKQILTITEVPVHRYNVGGAYLFINIDFTSVELRDDSLYYPWCDTLKNISIKKLLCKEHHRVPGDNGDEIQFDGFIFIEDGKEKLYNNQYPRASYSHLNDSMNWKIIDHLDDVNIVYTDITLYLETVINGMHSFKTNGDSEKETLLRKHCEDIVKLVNEDGYNVDIKPFEFVGENGEIETRYDVLKVVITKM